MNVNDTIQVRRTPSTTMGRAKRPVLVMAKICKLSLTSKKILKGKLIKSGLNGGGGGGGRWWKGAQAHPCVTLQPAALGTNDFEPPVEAIPLV